MVKMILQFFCVAVVALGLPGWGQAKEKTPPQYQSATLKEIKETKEPQTVYRQVPQPDGSTINLPQTEYKKVYHIKVALGEEIVVGRWSPTFSFGKVPSWTLGQPVPIRIQKNHMWLKKPNGKELKTTIEQRSQAD
jgi:hypothetical protein